jgi:general secretion pathway protein M
MSRTLSLPDGKRGQALAVGVGIFVLILLWFALPAPLLAWYQLRADDLAQQRATAVHMAALGREIPALQTAVSSAGLQADGNQVLLAGNTDAIAGANLQSALQNLAAQAGTSLDSAALLPVQPDGSLRRIDMQVSVTATWPVLIALLQAIGTARPYMVVDQISITRSSQPTQGLEQPMQASFSVTGFRTDTP